MKRDLSRRNRQPEMMDSPDIPDERLIESLDSLGLVNWLTSSLRMFWPEVLAVSARNPNRPVRILDVASGGGDTLIRLYQRGRRARLPLDLAGCDVNPVALAHARSSARAAGAAVDFFRYDATRDRLPDGFDIIMSSLFLHHLDEHDAVALLAEAAARAGDRLIVHDVTRSYSGFWFVRVGASLLLLSETFRTDGERSVEGAFTPGEVAALARQAGLTNAEVRPLFPFRFVMRWVRSA